MQSPVTICHSFTPRYHTLLHNQFQFNASCQRVELSRAGLVIPKLDELVLFYFKHSIAPTTAKTYETAKKRFVQYCVHSAYSPLPLTENLLCNFIVYLAAQGLKHTSIKGYLSGLRYFRLEHLGIDPTIGDMALLQQTLKGVKRIQARGRQQTRTRLPITTNILYLMRAVWAKEPSDYDNIMLWAASSLCFFGFFRSGEISVPTSCKFDPECHLTIQDISVDDPSNPKAVCLNSQRQIRSVKVWKYTIIGATDNQLCPVTALMAYLAIRDRDLSSPLFKFRNNEPLTGDRFVREVRKALWEAGLDQSKHAGHSFRSGVATQAAASGLEDSLIKTLGRWESSAYQVYIQLPRQCLLTVASHLAHTPK